MWVNHPDGTAATVASGEDVWLYGTEDLWARVEQVNREYLALGSPAGERFGVAVSDTGETWWLVDPAGLLLPLHVSVG